MGGAGGRVALSSELPRIALFHGKESKVSSPFLAHVLVHQGLVAPSAV